LVVGKRGAISIVRIGDFNHQYRKQNVALVERFMIPITILKPQIATIWKGNLIPSPGKTG